MKLYATGDVMFLHLLGKPVVILSSENVARDLLDKRSSIYSDRPRIALWELCVVIGY